VLAFSGHALRAARKSAGLRPEQLAREVERSVYSIHGYEWGRVVPSVPVLARLAATLGCPIESFFCEERRPSRSTSAGSPLPEKARGHTRAVGIQEAPGDADAS
jgi:transcriptional regulator with XRE-family HTH domain